MSAAKDSLLTRLVDRVFPRMPDFYSLLNEQCDLAVEAMEVFVQFMENGDKAMARQVRALEKRGRTQGKEYRHPQQVVLDTHGS